MKDIQSTNYNQWPSDTAPMNEYDWAHFISTPFYGIEFRQPFTDGKDHLSEIVNMKIFWINKECTLGYGFVSQYIDEEMIIKYYKIGKKSDWDKRDKELCETMA